MKITERKDGRFEAKIPCPFTAQKLKDFSNGKNKGGIWRLNHRYDNDNVSPCKKNHRISIYPSSRYLSKSELDSISADAVKNIKLNLFSSFNNKPNGKASFIEVHKDYMAWFKKRIGTKGFADKTYESYEHVARGHVYSTSIGASDIGSIDSIDLENLYDELQEKFILEGLGADLFNLVSVVVKAVFSHAVTKRFINDNPYNQLVSEKANKIRLDLKEEKCIKF